MAFFHADPHPGNLFATLDGRMAYIDFGMMDQLSESMKETIASAVVQLINRDYRGLAEDLSTWAFYSRYRYSAYYSSTGKSIRQSHRRKCR